ncbi:YjjG family noncanonical pyrimidine nucleotidase [Facklamia sp. 7083-14-GEN3]|uniref:YjjG family noncanonical pyrimidine nucleotidase n=1 Tax=Facklamia sp. 7083-14-GEN3 TaxID=2973478 RepID=UPI00215CE9F0|nr:YjjG family noncanonical pyrimidine nucleotidase [Facklamia sp. 7083-14-GEN3]MCR8968949.1 YjjG family noncanonical pyrimidine nucleotidase [Facklamia sp. 7083-14-GEN3]
MTYQLLLFDLDNTLFNFNQAQDQALLEFLSQEGVPQQDIAAYIEYYIPLNQSLWNKLELGLIDRQQLISSRFALLFNHFGHQRDGVELAQAYQKCMGRQGQLIEGARVFLDSCLKEGKRLFAISNGISNIQRARLAHGELNLYFEEIFISEEIGYVKPAKDFFDYVAKHIEGFNSKQALVIGDSLSADIQGALNAGLDCVWFNRLNENKQSHLPANYVVDNYNDLAKIIYK